MREFLAYMPKRLDEYDKMVMQNRIFKARTNGIGAYTTERGASSGASPARGCGPAAWPWDFRKEAALRRLRAVRVRDPHGRRAATATTGPSCAWRRCGRACASSQQCVENMPAGPYKSRPSRSTTPPLKERTMHDIETLITHFLGVSWGPVIPPGEALCGVEATKGNNGYYLISDGSTMPYRMRIRTPSFPHMQMIPLISRGLMMPDLLAMLGQHRFVMADVDR